MNKKYNWEKIYKDVKKSELARQMGDDLSRHIEEFACAFASRTNKNPVDCVMVVHLDPKTGFTYYYMEKKRGRKRKDILDKAKLEMYKKLARAC